MAPGRFMRSAKSKVRSLRRLLSDTSGANIPIIAAAMIPMVGTVGAAVDFSVAYMVKSQLQAAVDAAVLAGGTVANDATKRDTVINSYFSANFPTGYMGSTLEELTITPATVPDPVPDQISLEVTANATLPTQFLGIFGINNFEVSANAKVETGQNTAPLEAVLVLDNTWSMAYCASHTSNAECGNQANKRIVALRNATNLFFDTVFSGTAEPEENIAIGIVPYTTTANVGHLLDQSYVRQYTGYTESTIRGQSHAWAGCMAAEDTVNLAALGANEANAFDIRAYIPDATSDNPNSPKFKPLLVPPIYLSNGGPNDRNNLYKVPNANAGVWKRILEGYYHNRLAGQTVLNGQGNVDTSRVRARWSSGASYTSYNSWRNPRAWQPSTQGGTSGGGGMTSTSEWNPNGETTPGPNADCPAEALLPRLTNTLSSLKSYVASKVTSVKPGLGTHSNMGMIWAYRMLKTPEVFQGFTPSNADKPNKVRAIVLMTDGRIQYLDTSDSLSISSRTVAGGDIDGKDLYAGHGNYTAYKLPQQKLITNSSNSATVEAQLSNRLAKICAAAKADGIRIYTIAFAINPTDTTTHNLYRNCASSPSYYFNSTNGQALADAFQKIAVDLVQLHLVK